MYWYMLRYGEICAERNAVFNMLTNGKSQIAKIVCIMVMLELVR